MKKILVLGSNSFAGRQCVAYFQKNDYEVIGASRSGLPNDIFFDCSPKVDFSRFRFFQIDINRDWEALQSLCDQEKPPYIIDMAGQGMVAESWLDPEQWYQTNILAKVRLHQWLKDCDWLERYIKVSTPEVYGSTAGAVTEEQGFAPSTPYAVSHAAIDMSLKTFYQQHQFPVVLTRFANFYGPGQQLFRIIPRAFIYGFLGKKLPLHGGGTATRAFIHGQDVASALHAVITSGKNGETYHFSTSEIISIRELVELIANQCQLSMDELCEISEDRPGKDAQYFMDSSKAHADLGWQSAVSMDEGLIQVGEWVKRNLEIIKTMNLNYQHKA